MPNISALREEVEGRLSAIKADAEPVGSPPLGDDTNLLSEVVKRLDTSESTDMFMVRSQDGNVSWVICEGVDPVATICLSDQDNSDAIASYFSSSEYKSAVLEAVKTQNTWKNALESVKANIISNGHVVQIEKSGVDEGQIRDTFIKRFTRAAEMANSAMAKNLVDNPLKAHFFDVLSSNGVANPYTIVESIFEEGGQETLQTLVSKAVEWMNLSEDALSELESQIGMLEKKDMSAAVLEEGNEDTQSLASQLEDNSVSLTTGNGGQPQDVRDRFRQTLRGTQD